MARCRSCNSLSETNDNGLCNDCQKTFDSLLKTTIEKVLLEYMDGTYNGFKTGKFVNNMEMINPEEVKQKLYSKIKVLVKDY